MRADFIDNIEYVNGVKAQDGQIAIRPLTEDEVEFLNRFNKEYYHASFDKDDSKNIHKKTEDVDLMLEVKEKIKELKSQLNQSIKETKRISKEIQKLEDQYKKINPRKLCTDDNNARNRCLFNKAKAWNLLDPFLGEDPFDDDND